MCGIAGIFDTRGEGAIDAALLSRMNDSLRHRGPDGEGVFKEGGIGLGHRRLAIIDLEGGAQPLFNEDKSVAVVFNGEIYNFQELARELVNKGHQFRTHCDTEVIVHGWEEWGEACLDRFRGMFSFAIWDGNKKTLFLARDRLGIKPLYYTLRGDNSLLFASELKALLLDASVPRIIDPRAVEDYFAYGYIPDPATIYQGIYKLPPGHFLKFRRGNPLPAPIEYWDVHFGEPDEVDEQEAAEQLIEKARDAVKCRMIADVPLGAFLSGGVDSSGIVALMAGLSDDPVNTCSISFGSPEFDESPYAAKVAKIWGTDHHVAHVDPDSYDLMDRLATLYDEPFADSSAMPTYRVCELARNNVTVALSGDGGDEIFGGYRRHLMHCNEERVRRILPAGFRRLVFGALGSLYPKMDWAPQFLRARSTFQSLARDSAGAYFNSVSVVYDDVRAKMFSPAFQSSLQGYNAGEVLARHMARAGTDDMLSQIQYADLKTYLPGDILTKVDRASMAHSLEVRVPLLDHKFVEWAATIPSSLKLRGGQGKYLLKKALEPLVPHDVMYRPKMGFSVPISAWFRGPLRDRVRSAVTGPVIADSGIFDSAYLARLVSEHESGQREHSPILWSILMFEAFLRQVHEVGGGASSA
jgi:asparagine synthase (glutamine-hydrolysing)